MKEPASFVALIDPELGTSVIILLGWVMVGLGVFKMLFYLIGEIAPSTWDKIKSPAFRKLLTGNGNRLLFGLGGLLTVILGLGAIGMAYLIRRLNGML